ncbi:hypothetical protein EDD15DRAFT_2409854 [Pisolithus albus]|nr:hypothetical protein EDD15DRAFT_2409854 [Pisolithus albus]
MAVRGRREDQPNRNESSRHPLAVDRHKEMRGHQYQLCKWQVLGAAAALFAVRVSSPAIVFLMTLSLLYTKPFPSLSPSPITPVVVQSRVPRTTLILVFLSLSALSFLIDGLAYITYAVFNRAWSLGTGIPLASVLGLVAYAGLAALGAWKDINNVQVWFLTRVRLAIAIALALDITQVALTLSINARGKYRALNVSLTFSTSCESGPPPVSSDVKWTRFQHTEDHFIAAMLERRATAKHTLLDCTGNLPLTVLSMTPVAVRASLDLADAAEHHCCWRSWGRQKFRHQPASRPLKDVASVSSDVDTCTKAFAEHKFTVNSTEVCTYDTMGFSSAHVDSLSRLVPYEKACNLISSLKSKINIVLLTYREKENSMDSWWGRNSKDISKFRFALRGTRLCHRPMFAGPGIDLRYQQISGLRSGRALITSVGKEIVRSVGGMDGRKGKVFLRHTGSHDLWTRATYQYQLLTDGGLLCEGCMGWPSGSAKWVGTGNQSCDPHTFMYSILLQGNKITWLQLVWVAWNHHKVAPGWQQPRLRGFDSSSGNGNNGNGYRHNTIDASHMGPFIRDEGQSSSTTTPLFASSGQKTSVSASSSLTAHHRSIIIGFNAPGNDTFFKPDIPLSTLQPQHPNGKLFGILPALRIS